MSLSVLLFLQALELGPGQPFAVLQDDLQLFFPTRELPGLFQRPVTFPHSFSIGFATILQLDSWCSNQTCRKTKLTFHSVCFYCAPPLLSLTPAPDLGLSLIFQVNDNCSSIILFLCCSGHYQVGRLKGLRKALWIVWLNNTPNDYFITLCSRTPSLSFLPTNIIIFIIKMFNMKIISFQLCRKNIFSSVIVCVIEIVLSNSCDRFWFM